MRPSGASNWLARAGCAVLVFGLTLGTTGLVQAITGAGTPCGGCTARCYQYYAGLTPAAGGCKTPSGFPDYTCLEIKCGASSTWCNGCIPNDTYSTDCENPNCWMDGSAVGGGSLCSDYCNGSRCDRGAVFGSVKHCGQVAIPDCDPYNTSLSCTKCACKDG